MGPSARATRGSDQKKLELAWLWGSAKLNFWDWARAGS